MSANVMTVKAPPGDRTDELIRLMERVDKKQPKDEDVRALYRLLIEAPDLWQGVADLTTLTRNRLIGKITSQTSLSEMIRVTCVQMRRDLGHKGASTLERLLIEQIILTWLRLQWAETQLTALMDAGSSRDLVQHWEKRLSAAQRRHLRAIESLARVRKLSAGIVQINVAAAGGQQVNTTGDVQPNSSAKGRGKGTES